MSKAPKTLYYRKVPIHSHRPEKRINNNIDPITQVLKNNLLLKIKNIDWIEQLSTIKRKDKFKTLPQKRNKSLQVSLKGKKIEIVYDRQLLKQNNIYNKNLSIRQLMKNKKARSIDGEQALQENSLYKIQKRRNTNSYSFSTFTADIPSIARQKKTESFLEAKLKLHTLTKKSQPHKNYRLKTDIQIRQNSPVIAIEQKIECRNKSQTKIYEDLKNYFQNKYCKNSQQSDD